MRKSHCWEVMAFLHSAKKLIAIHNLILNVGISLYICRLTWRGKIENMGTLIVVVD